MAFGFSPKHLDSIKKEGLTEKEALITAIESAKKLNWNIGLVSRNGFIAYTKTSFTSWAEEVQIKIQDDFIELKSECASSQLIDWGKNKKNIEEFISKFTFLKNEIKQEEIESLYAGIEKDFASEEENTLNVAPLSQKEKLSGLLSILKPSENFYITPILLNLNIALFIIMAITGVNIIMPDIDSLLLWGANYKPATLDGEWWRIISSCFLHIGIFHLLMNMYALLYIGVLLEPHLGKARFLSAYLLTGIAGSIASLYWNELTVSAGASGAIFGMYGVFLAMLTTNLIEKSARKALLTSIAVFVAYNLLNGLKGDIDNAAHIGGLLSGLVIGYAFYPSLKKPNEPKLAIYTVSLLSAVILATSVFVLSTTEQSDIEQYEKEMALFVQLETKALEVYGKPEMTTDQEYMNELEFSGIPSWKANLEVMERVEQLNLPEEIEERNTLLKEYCKKRIECYKLIYKAIKESTNDYQPEIDVLNYEIETLINQLSEL